MSEVLPVGAVVSITAPNAFRRHLRGAKGTVLARYFPPWGDIKAAYKVRLSAEGYDEWFSGQELSAFKKLRSL